MVALWILGILLALILLVLPDIAKRLKKQPPAPGREAQPAGQARRMPPAQRTLVQAPTVYRRPEYYAKEAPRTQKVK